MLINYDHKSEAAHFPFLEYLLGLQFPGVRILNVIPCPSPDLQVTSWPCDLDLGLTIGFYLHSSTCRSHAVPWADGIWCGIVYWGHRVMWRRERHHLVCVQVLSGQTRAHVPYPVRSRSMALLSRKTGITSWKFWSPSMARLGWH